MFRRAGGILLSPLLERMDTGLSEGTSIDERMSGATNERGG